jgi:hypothetical protein
LKDTESLGPYGARYFGSKLWYGESWFMQIDAHMNFLQDWDVISIQGLQKAPSDKPILSHYPPGHKMDLIDQSFKPAGRLCGPLFNGESQVVRLEGLAVRLFVCLRIMPPSNCVPQHVLTIVDLSVYLSKKEMGP